MRERRIEEIKKVVNKPLNWDSYNSTNVINSTNCFSHAIGSTIIDDLSLYRLGMISKNTKIEYSSIEELKELFLEDAKMLGLNVEEIKMYLHKHSVLQCVEKLCLNDNQYFVLLFAKTYQQEGKQKIRDFHFFRFDQDKGWSEKIVRNEVHFVKDMTKAWPSSWSDKPVGLFTITRKE